MAPAREIQQHRRLLEGGNCGEIHNRWQQGGQACANVQCSTYLAHETSKGVQHADAINICEACGQARPSRALLQQGNQRRRHT
eukprot:3011581-Alexandrium_andersonii.AAC.1